jgi:hypothetical protein
MCDPVTALAVGSFAITAGSAIVENKAKSQQSKENKSNALEAFQANINALDTRETQEKDAAGQTIMQADRQARAADALAKVSAGEAGVAGASVDAVLQNLTRQKNTFDVSAKENLHNTLTQIEAEKSGASATAQSRINSAPPPNPFLSVLQIGEAGINFGNTVVGNRPKPKQ